MPCCWATRLSTLSWTNDLMLTQGNWPIDVALHTQWISDRIVHGKGAFEYGPALQTDIGRTQINLNAFFERGTGRASQSPTMLKYQWQLRRRWLPQLQFGLQGFGELGPWDNWNPHSRQSNRRSGTVRHGQAV